MADPEQTTIAELIPDDRNANAGSARGLDMIQKSLQKHGAGRSILLDKHGRIIAGNKTVEAAGLAGMDDVIVIESHGDKIIAHRRMDLDLDDPETRELAILDNRTSEVSMTWDAQVITELVNDGVDFTDAFTDDELADLLSKVEEKDGGLLDDADPDDVPDKSPDRVIAGDLWRCGKHLLYCGDSTVETHVSALLGDDVVDLVVTDPPYGVAYTGVSLERRAIDNDALSKDGTHDLIQAALSIIPLKAGGAFYVFSPSGPMETVFRCAIMNAGWDLRACLVWVKNMFVVGMQDYHYKHESILTNVPDGAEEDEKLLEHSSIVYGWKPGGAHQKVRDRTQTSVWEFDKPSRSEQHPTMKPVAMLERAINNSSRPGQIVYDAFGGSGSTMIACEATGRVCRMMEKDPNYCDVILARWETLTGNQAERVLREED